MQPDNEINGAQKTVSLNPRQSIDIVNQTRNKPKDSKPTAPTIKSRSHSKKNSKYLFLILFTILIVVVFIELLYLAYIKSK